MVHQTRFELARLPTRPSSVRVYLFRHWCVLINYKFLNDFVNVIIIAWYGISKDY